MSPIEVLFIYISKNMNSIPTFIMVTNVFTIVKNTNMMFTEMY